jgi:cytochrome P450
MNRTFQRITRRVVFGERAADDASVTAELGDLMSAGNRMPGKPAGGYESFLHRVQAYVDAAEDGSLCALAAAAPKDADTEPAEQIVHWLFAMGDTLPANLFRALAVLATHDDQRAEVLRQLDGADLSQPQWIADLDYLAACIQEAMRLWPTTALFGRVAVRDVRFPSGQTLREGGNVLIYNVFNHRNRDRIPYADRFAPEEWISGEAADNWAFNFFSHGPQGCPGAGLSLFLGQAVLAHLLTRTTPELVGGGLQPDRPLPHALDIFGLTVRCGPLGAE